MSDPRSKDKPQLTITSLNKHYYNIANNPDRPRIYWSAHVEVGEEQVAVYNKFGSWMVYEKGTTAARLERNPEAMLPEDHHWELLYPFSQQMQTAVKKRLEAETQHIAEEQQIELDADNE